MGNLFNYIKGKIVIVWRFVYSLILRSIDFIKVAVSSLFLVFAKLINANIVHACVGFIIIFYIIYIIIDKSFLSNVEFFKLLSGILDEEFLLKASVFSVFVSFLFKFCYLDDNIYFIGSGKSKSCKVHVFNNLSSVDIVEREDKFAQYMAYKVSDILRDSNFNSCKIELFGLFIGYYEYKKSDIKNLATARLGGSNIRVIPGNISNCKSVPLSVLSTYSSSKLFLFVLYKFLCIFKPDLEMLDFHKQVKSQIIEFKK